MATSGHVLIIAFVAIIIIIVVVVVATAAVVRSLCLNSLWGLDDTNYNMDIGLFKNLCARDFTLQLSILFCLFPRYCRSASSFSFLNSFTCLSFNDKRLTLTLFNCHDCMGEIVEATLT